MKQDFSEPGRLLVALHSHEEWVSLRRILGGTSWKLCDVATFSAARAALLQSSFDVVICTAQFGGGHSWKDMLAEVRSTPVPPVLIVADRLADSALWAEVLNLGGYDLLITPFEAAEVLRVVPMACEFRKRQTESPLAYPKLPNSADVNRSREPWRPLTESQRKRQWQHQL